MPPRTKKTSNRPTAVKQTHGRNRKPPTKVKEADSKRKSGTASAAATEATDAPSISSSNDTSFARVLLTKPVSFLLKSEPHEFSIDDLRNKPNSRAEWDGIRNFEASKILKTEMKVGDLAYFYHSSCKDVGIVGLVEVVRSGKQILCIIET